jgi:glycosyltransferase involved in cell wall biosynthesis
MTHEEVIEKLSVAHLFVFPTRLKEGFPKAVLEAMACGLPVIATSVSVLPQLIGENCGILLSKTGADAVSEAIIKLISTPKEIPIMSANARRTSEAYSLERWRDDIGHQLFSQWGPLRSEINGVVGEP